MKKARNIIICFTFSVPEFELNLTWGTKLILYLNFSMNYHFTIFTFYIWVKLEHFGKSNVLCSSTLVNLLSKPASAFQNLIYKIIINNKTKSRKKDQKQDLKELMLHHIVQNKQLGLKLCVMSMINLLVRWKSEKPMRNRMTLKVTCCCQLESLYDGLRWV